MKDFEQWMNDRGKGETEEVDDVYYFHCWGCGKEEYVSLAEYTSGSTSWYINHFGKDGKANGVCGKGPHCLP